MSRTLTIACFAIAIAPAVPAAPYWVGWEGNDYPENEGWERITHDAGPAERTLAGGVMTMDGLADSQIDDYFRMDRPLDPGAREEFVMQWRLRVYEVNGLKDPGIGLFSDDDWELLLVFGVDFIRSFHEDTVIPFEPDIFHTFEVRSSDMQSYELQIDGLIVYAGGFWEPSFRQARIEWGDYTRGASSLVDWDYFRFGVVPEPASAALIISLFGACVLVRPRPRMSRIPVLGCLAVGMASNALAAPYWVAWEGDDFPENEGWERGHFGADGPQAERTLNNGVMTLDGLASIEIIDGYLMERPLDPGPGEEFVAQWRLRVNEVNGNPNFLYDPGVRLTSDDGWHIALVIGVDEVHSILDQEDVGYKPWVFHAWEFRSADMRSYSLSVDGSIVHTGTLTETGATEPQIEWGDLVGGSTSHSDWDYFRFGVVPEPTSCISLLALLCAVQGFRRN